MIKIGDIEKEKYVWWRNKKWLVCIKVEKNYKKFQSFDNYEHAIIFSELIKQKKFVKSRRQEK